MTETIGIIQGVRIDRITDIFGNETVRFTADYDEDNDGIDSDPSDGINNNPEHDPCHQNDTSLHGPDGKPLDPYKVPYIVIPPLICQRTKGIVLGSECLVSNRLNGLDDIFVAGDTGPHNKIGEGSPFGAKLLGLHVTAFNGESRNIIDYEIRVGKPANIKGVQYGLKHWRG